MELASQGDDKAIQDASADEGAFAAQNRVEEESLGAGGAGAVGAALGVQLRFVALQKFFFGFPLSPFDQAVAKESAAGESAYR